MKTLMLSERSIHAGNLILVNGQHPCYREIAESALVPIPGDGDKILLERRAAALLGRLMSDIDGWGRIVAVSGWRSEGEQRGIYDRSLRENGAAFTAQFVAEPNHSEHQTGLAIDLGLKQAELDFIRPGFPYSGICQTFREKAAAYGFIERYPKGKEAITGIAHEPWHFRYVGVPHASIMTELGLTLEEYHAFLKRHPHGTRSFAYQSGRQAFAISYAAAAGREAVLEIEADCPYLISGNNMDGFVLTEWRSLGDERQRLSAKEAARC
ncbi:MAG: M15 family metallopeptidase [Bacillota bacterium]